MQRGSHAPTHAMAWAEAAIASKMDGQSLILWKTRRRRKNDILRSRHPQNIGTRSGRQGPRSGDRSHAQPLAASMARTNPLP
jgi:hypothetical protein